MTAEHDGSFLSSLLPLDDVGNCSATLDDVQPRFENPFGGSQDCVSLCGTRRCTSAYYCSKHGNSASSCCPLPHNNEKSCCVMPLCSSMEGIVSRSNTNSDVNVIDGSVLSDLGIIGLLSEDKDIDDELISIFPTPSPQETHRKFKLGSKCSSHTQESSKITKRCAISLFDSPEDSRRGWSELGLKIRQIYHTPPSHRTNFFGFVADEIMLSIFGMMPKPVLVKCARVCKRWKRLVFDESLWKRLDLGGRLIPPAALGHCVLNRGNEILRLSGAEINYPVYSSATLLQPCKLQYLDLSMANISLASLQQLFSQCRQLQKLSLENLSINDNICSLLSKNLYLTSLNLAMAQGFTHAGLGFILSKCSLLTELNISWTRLASADLRSIVSSLPSSILYLNISGYRENMTDQEVESLVSQCQSLIELDLSDSLGLTEDTVKYIKSTLYNLEILHLSRCYYIPPESMISLRELCNLRTLNVFSMMQEENLKALIRALPNVRINSQLFSRVARPTVEPYRTSIWGHKTRDIPV